MRYANLIPQKLALFDLPKIKYDQTQNKYLEKIFRQLLVFDALPEDDLASVLNEASQILKQRQTEQPIVSPGFEKYIRRERNRAKWQKISKDYNYYFESKFKRRNIENPYSPKEFEKIESWNNIPDWNRRGSGQSWQYDSLCKEAQYLAGQISELTKDYENSKDKDLSRARIYGILVPNKIIFALNSNDELYESDRTDAELVNLKLGMDAYRQAYTFANRLIESLHKLRWNLTEKTAEIDKAIRFADMILDKLRARISDMEKKYMLFMDSSFDAE